MKIKDVILLQIFSIIISNTNIFIFNSERYRAGHSALKTNGDMVIEYSYDNKRLFFGLKSNGNFYFQDNMGKGLPTKFFEFSESNYNRLESRNIFINLNSSSNNREYLFSIGTSSESTQTIAELYNLDIFDVKGKPTTEILSHNIISNTFSLYQIHNTNNYLLTYLTSSSCYLKLFSFSDFSLDNIIIKSIEEGTINNSFKNINSFQMNDKIILLYFFSYYLKMNIYELSLTKITKEIEIEYIASMASNQCFFKGIHLEEDKIALMYYFSKAKYRIFGK